MEKCPEFDANGDLSVGIHQATLTEILQFFRTRTVQRYLLGERLERIYTLAHSTRKVARFIVFGSFLTAKFAPGDVDIFLLMEDSFDANQASGEAALIFDDQEAQDVLGQVFSGFANWQRWAASRKQ